MVRFAWGTSNGVFYNTAQYDRIGVMEEFPYPL